VSQEAGPRVNFYKRLSGSATFWEPSALLRLPEVEQFDEPTQCVLVALRVAETFGYQVVNGYVATEEYRPVWHCFNRDPASGQLIDAAEARGIPAIGHLGKVLTPAEVKGMERWYEQPTAQRRLEVAGARLTDFGRVLDGMIGGRR
jgi:hypothetical protein